MLSNYYYAPELAWFMAFYWILGVACKKVAPSPGDINKITPYFYYMYYTNLVSLIHSILGIVLPALWFYFYGFEMNRKALYVHHLVMLNSNVYFVYDFIMEIRYKILDTPTAMHHVIVVLMGSYFFWNPYGGDEYMMTLFLGELANPCLITRTIMKSLRMTDTEFFTYLEAIFAVSFVVIRAFVSPFWSELWLRAENCPLEWKFGIAVVFWISMSWNAKIFAIFIKRYKQMVGNPPKLLVTVENFFDEIEKNWSTFIKFYGILAAYSFIYPLVYYGMYKQTLFLSY